MRELLSNDGADEKTRTMARWCLEREGDPNALTREVGRIFLARDMGCAQCHDGGVAPPLPRKSYTVTDVTAGIWRHGPQVRRAMANQRMTWPHLAASDIADLVAWLNAR